MSVNLLGKSPAVRDLKKMIERVAGTKTNVLIIGESGTGKELVARMIHDLSPQKTHPFIPINCGAIPENLIETELFGHRKGSFTGAVNDKMGLFEAANQGTLFLDEVGERPLATQVKLLRAIQERVIRKVGGVDDIHIDVRIVAATNRDLEAGVKKGTFREDLYYRLNVILIRTPALRDREGDIQLLSEKFLGKFADGAGKKVDGFTPEALAALEGYSWPGNVRELENCLERAVTLEETSQITLESLSEVVRKSDASLSHGTAVTVPPADFSRGNLNLTEILGEIEKQYIDAALHHAGGPNLKAAQLLGYTLAQLRQKIK